MPGDNRLVVFFDTNVLVYAVHSHFPDKSRVARRLLVEALQQANGWISYQVVQEFANVLLAGRRPYSATEVRRYISEMCDPFRWVRSSRALVDDALQLREQYQIAWYDALIVAAAREANCDVLWSEDLTDAQNYGGVRVQNPFRELDQTAKLQ